MSRPDFSFGPAPCLRAARVVGSLYGAKPHESAAKRRAGYPHGQAQPVQTRYGWRTTGPLRVETASSWQGSQRAKDAASRPEKPAVLNLSCAFFYPARKNLQSNQELKVLYIV